MKIHKKGTIPIIGTKYEIKFDYEVDDTEKELDENKLFRKEGCYLSGCAYCPPGEPGKPGDWQGEENHDK